METLRQNGFKGRVILVAGEGVLPYDRPKISKALTTGAEKLALRNTEFYNVSQE